MATLNSLSNELIIAIGEYCPVPDLARLARTHRRFNNLFSSSIYERNILHEPYRESCLLYAATYKRMDIIKIALAHGADLNGRPPPPPPQASTRTRRGGRLSIGRRNNYKGVAPRPLHVAAWNGDEDMVEFLLANGASHDVSWHECEDDHDGPDERRLPSFLTQERMAKKPVPPSFIREGLALDAMAQDANSFYRRHPPSGHYILGALSPRDMRHQYPLLTALSLPEPNNVASMLVRNGARLATSYGCKALRCAFLAGNVRMFDKLLRVEPSHADALDTILFDLSARARSITLEMMRHAFLKLWAPNLPDFPNQDSFSENNAGLVFFSIITGRFKEALSLIDVASDVSWNTFNYDFQSKFLHHVWWDGSKEDNVDLSLRMPDDNLPATKYELTKALAARDVDCKTLLRVSNSSELWVSPLYLVAVGSAKCPHRSAALKFILEEGTSQRHIATYATGQHLSLLQYFVNEAAKERDIAKFARNIVLCLDFDARLHDIGYGYHSECSGTLEFSILAWNEPDGRRPLFEFLLDNSGKHNVDVSYIAFLVGKDFVRQDARVRDALFKFAEVVLGESVSAVGPPPTAVFD